MRVSSNDLAENWIVHQDLAKLYLVESS